jgi:hypothetical protein
MTPSDLLDHHRKELQRTRERAVEIAEKGAWREVEAATVEVALAEAALRAAEEMLEACGPQDVRGGRT